MKIALIGTSQLGAVKEYSDEAITQPVKLTYFASDNSSYVPGAVGLDAKQGRLVALSEYVKTSWTRAHAPHVDLSNFDHFILFGFDQFNLRSCFLTDFEKTPLSVACRQQQLVDIFGSHPAIILLKLLRTHTSRATVSVMNGPLFTSKAALLLNASQSKDLSAGRKAYDAYWRTACKEMNAVYVPQPKKTIDVNGISTDAQFLKEDGFHLTKEGAGLFLREALEPVLPK